MGVTPDPTDPRLTRGVDDAPTDQADAYLVLSADERARGFVEPVRRSYIHVVDLGGCGALTSMNVAIAETYARTPEFYGATYCVGCRMHRPVGTFGEFVWAGTEQRVGTRTEPPDPAPETPTWRWTIPEALADEDGERWFLQGHVDPPLAILALALEQIVNDCDVEQALAGGKTRRHETPSGELVWEHGFEGQRDHADDLLAAVRHVWCREDPDNEDRILLCEQTDDGAEPWTWIGP